MSALNTLNCPMGWELLPVKYCLEIPITDGPHETPEILQDGIPFISAEAVKNNELDFSKKRGFISADEHARFSRKYKPIRGDVYMVKSGATTGNVARVMTDEEFNIWSPLAALRPDKKRIVSDFLFYSMLSKSFRHSVEQGWSFGTQQNIGMWVISNLQIPVPPLQTQQKIADFLDRKTAQIDGLIEKKRQLIAKLKEKRLAVITQAVTRGLNPDAPLKDSGIEWLGQVPAHWEVMKYGYRTNIQQGQVDPEIEPYSEMMLIAPNHIESNTGRLLELSTARDQSAISGKYLVQKGDIVYSKIRPHLNKVALSKEPGLCSADMYPIRTEEDLIPEYLFYWMIAQPFLDYATLSSMRVAMPKLNRETLSSAPLLLPPTEEQKSIVETLDLEIERLDNLTGKTKEVINRLTEYRTALITAAVTGQLEITL